MEEKKTFELELADGKKIMGTVNGNNLITKQEIEGISDADLIGATLDGAAVEMMACCNLWKDREGTHIILRKKSKEELRNEELESKLEYLAMMADIDL